MAKSSTTPLRSRLEQARWAQTVSGSCAVIGVPPRWGQKKVWLHEASARAIWEDTDSKWALADIARVEFPAVTRTPYFSWLVRQPTGEH